MNALVVATVYAWMAHCLAFVLLPWSISLSLRVRAIAFWMVAAPMVFFLHSPLIVFAVLGVLMLVIAPLADRERAAYFLAIVPAVPHYLNAEIPFPGINFLFEINHYKLTALLLLLPLLFVRRNPYGRPATFAIGDLCLPIYIVYTAIIVVIQVNPTNGMRLAFDQFVVLALPYFVLRSILRSAEDIDAFLEAFLVASMVLAFISIISTYKQWDYYLAAGNVFNEFRGGRLRVVGPANTHSLGFHLAAAICLLEFLKQRISIHWIKLNAMRVVLFVGILGTASRGALGGLVVAGMTYFLIMLKGHLIRWAVIASCCIAAVVGAIWLSIGDVSSVDQHGTFVYRQELLRTSVAYIMMHPIWGDYFYLRSGYFDHLLQGQGIIDVTNMYLQIALQYGLFGLGLMLLVLAGPVVSLLFALRAERIIRLRKLPGRIQRRGAGSAGPVDGNAESAAEAAEYEVWRRASATMVALVIGWLFLVTTTSDVALTLYLGLIFAALCRALLNARPEALSAFALRPASGRRTVVNELRKPAPSAVRRSIGART